VTESKAQMGEALARLGPPEENLEIIIVDCQRYGQRGS